MAKKIRRRIPQEGKIRSQLQQEINSVCPFCDNTDVGHFQVHHINGEPNQNEFKNLLLVCPACHSKITKGDINQQEVVAIKTGLPNSNIEFVSVTIDSKNCSWTSYDDFPNAFLDRESEKSPFPIFNFSLINHTKQTILLTAIKIGTKHLYSGLSGFPSPRVLRSSVKYRFPVSGSEEYVTHILEDELEIPSQQAFKFQVELFEGGRGDLKYEIDGRKILYFLFVFGKYFIKIPDVFLNCKGEDDKV